jgi:malate dehydrogenase (oxaloacetate-decarboxylating)(NADP+)
MDAYRASLAQRPRSDRGFLQKRQGAVLSAPRSASSSPRAKSPRDPRRLRLPERGLGGHPVGREDLVHENMVPSASTRPRPSWRSQRPALASQSGLCRLPLRPAAAHGYLRRDVQRLINQDRNAFAASMVALGDADGMVTGVTRAFDQVLEEVLQVVDPGPDGRIIGMSVVLAKGRTLFIADTIVTEMPEAEDLVEIASEAARAVRTWVTNRGWPS